MKDWASITTYAVCEPDKQSSPAAVGQGPQHTTLDCGGGGELGLRAIDLRQLRMSQKWHIASGLEDPVFGGSLGVGGWHKARSGGGGGGVGCRFVSQKRTHNNQAIAAGPPRGGGGGVREV